MMYSPIAITTNAQKVICRPKDLFVIFMVFLLFFLLFEYYNKKPYFIKSCVTSLTIHPVAPPPVRGSHAILAGQAISKCTQFLFSINWLKKRPAPIVPGHILPLVLILFISAMSDLYVLKYGS